MIWQDISGFITMTLGPLLFWLCYAARRFGTTHLARLKESSSLAPHKIILRKKLGAD
jgi:hypothetical protein